jgi:hypothetical protein
MTPERYIAELIRWPLSPQPRLVMKRKRKTKAKRAPRKPSRDHVLMAIRKVLLKRSNQPMNQYFSRARNHPLAGTRSPGLKPPGAF